MNVIKPIKFLMTIILFLFFSNLLFSQKLEPKERIEAEPDHIIMSEIMEKEYQLYISFPNNYSTNDTILYPVLYVVDGMTSFKFFNPLNIYLSRIGKIEDVIIVGISPNLMGKDYGINRFYDYTTSIDTIIAGKQDKRFGAPQGTVKTGGAESFLKSIKKEIVPFIDKHYKTNTDRGISGHSLGGLFTAYCLLSSDGFFTRFGVNSPSLQWGNEDLLKQAVLQFTTNETWVIPPTKVFISAGENESPLMVSNMIKFSLYLERSDYKNIDSRRHTFINETHLSVVPESLKRTLTTLYGKE